MPRGGPRPNSGRPTKEQAAAKAKALAEAAAKGPIISPRAYLQAMLDSTASTKSERMRAAELLLKLSPEPPPKPDSSPPLPRGAQIGDDGQSIVWPDGSTEPAQPLKPFEATPPLPPMPRRREPEPTLEAIEPEPQPFEVAEVTPPPNVTPLRAFERGVSFGARHDPSRRPEATDPFRYKPRGD
jgi:hypothetical protein